MSSRFACVGTLVAVSLGSIGSEPAAPQQSSPHTQPATQPQATRPNHDEQARLMEAIAALPAWTSSETLSEDEWRRLARAAAAFHTLDEANVAAVLAAYMKKYGEDLDANIPDPDPRTKPLLLLATMFDLGKPKSDDKDERSRDRSREGVQVCGGFAYRVNDSASRAEVHEHALPISWSEDGPTLTARRETKVLGQRGGPPRMPYEPWSEFHHFIRFYEKRTDFEPYSPSSAPSWRDLIADPKVTGPGERAPDTIKP